MIWSPTQLHEARAIEQAMKEYRGFSNNIESHIRNNEYLYIFFDAERLSSYAAPGLILVDGAWRVHPAEPYSSVNHEELFRYDSWQTAVIAFKLLWSPKQRS